MLPLYVYFCIIVHMESPINKVDNAITPLFILKSDSQQTACTRYISITFIIS